jgi:hypothetical protein
MNLPNLLIIGAPKCGTSAVYKWLTEHPDVVGGRSKEPFYLVDSGYYKWCADSCWCGQGEDGYERFFPDSAKWIVDGSTITLYQQAGLQYASRYRPRVIVFVREPAARIYSQFRYFKNNRSFIDPKLTFSDYLKLVKGECSFKGNNQLANAISESKYVYYLDLWKRAVGTEFIKVYAFESFFDNPCAGMTDIADWLGIDGGIYDGYKFSKENESLRIKSRTLNIIKERLAPRNKNYPLKDVIRRLYYSLNSSSADHYEVMRDRGTLNALALEFRESNEALFDGYGVGGWFNENG